MASTNDMCWSNSEELFTDLDLDALYSVQSERVAGNAPDQYPYMVLVYTGKITIAINLERQFDQALFFGFQEDGPTAEEKFLALLESAEREV